MIKNILLPLDNSPWTEGAKRYSFDIAKRHDALVTGVGIIDIQDIENEGIGAGLGSSYYSEKLTSSLLSDAEEKIETILERFEEDCSIEGVKYRELLKHGLPYWVIIEDAKYHDLVVMGLKSYFHFETSDKPGDTLQKVAEKGIRPILAVPPDFKEVKRVSAFVDGEGRDSKALFTFIHLKPYDIEELTLVHIARHEEKEIERGEWILGSYERFIESYGIKVKKKLLIGSVVESLGRFIEESKPQLLIMGYGVKKGLKGLIFGSISDRIIKESDIPIFLYK